MYREVAVAVYSINKHEFIQHLQGKVALAAEWIPPKALEFAVLMKGGFLMTFKAETDKQVPIQQLQLGFELTSFDQTAFFILPNVLQARQTEQKNAPLTSTYYILAQSASEEKMLTISRGEIVPGKPFSTESG